MKCTGRSGKKSTKGAKITAGSAANAELFFSATSCYNTPATKISGGF